MEEQTFIDKKVNADFDNIVNIQTTEVVYICGKRKVGKSYFLEYLAKRYPAYIVYDGATHQHASMGSVVRTSEELESSLNAGVLKIVCQPFKDGQEVFDKFCKVIWNKGNTTLMVEEIGNYCDGYSTSEYFDMLARVGRNRGIGVVAINQRPKRVWTNFVSLIEHWIIFSSDFPDDIRFLSEYIGVARAENLKALPKRFFYYKNDERVVLCNPIR
jgi:hypothetical protein